MINKEYNAFIREFFWNLLDNSYILKGTLESFFILKDGIYLFEYYIPYGNLWVSEQQIFIVLEKCFSLSEDDIKEFISEEMELVFKGTNRINQVIREPFVRSEATEEEYEFMLGGLKKIYLKEWIALK